MPVASFELCEADGVGWFLLCAMQVEDVVAAKPELLGKVQKMMERQQWGHPKYLEKWVQWIGHDVCRFWLYVETDDLLPLSFSISIGLARRESVFRGFSSVSVGGIRNSQLDVCHLDQRCLHRPKLCTHITSP